jgi:hypothetical protein
MLVLGDELCPDLPQFLRQKGLTWIPRQLPEARMSAAYISFRTGRSPKAFASIDDTIHAVTEFSKLIEHGVPKRKVVLAPYLRAFPAVVFTTVIVSPDSLVLGFSKLAHIWNLGAATFGVMVLCSLADLLLLPALLYSADGKSPRIGSLLS